MPPRSSRPSVRTGSVVGRQDILSNRRAPTVMLSDRPEVAGGGSLLAASELSLLLVFRKSWLWSRLAIDLRDHSLKAWERAEIHVPEMVECGMNKSHQVELTDLSVFFDWARGVLDSASRRTWPNKEVEIRLTQKIWSVIKPAIIAHINVTVDDTTGAGIRLAALHIAVGFGCVEATKLLLECPQLDVNVQTAPSLETPFHYASRLTHDFVEEAAVEILRRRLLEVDFDAKNSDLQTVDDMLMARTLRPSFLASAWSHAKRWLRETYYPQTLTVLNALFPREVSLCVLQCYVPISIHFLP